MSTFAKGGRTTVASLRRLLVSQRVTVRPNGMWARCKCGEAIEINTHTGVAASVGAVKKNKVYFQAGKRFIDPKARGL